MEELQALRALMEAQLGPLNYHIKRAKSGGYLVDIIIQNFLGIRCSDNEIRDFHIMLQFQDTSIKFAWQISQNYFDSESQWIDFIDPIFRDYRSNAALGFTRRNPPQHLAYYSVSKRTHESNLQQLANILSEELRNFRRLSVDFAERIQARITQ